MKKLLALATLTPLLISGSALAEPDLFGREGTYDMTGDPRIQLIKPDPAYIRGEGATFAEQRGLVSAPTVEERRNFMYVEDFDGTLTIPWRAQNDIFESFNFALREVYRVQPDEFIFVYLFTSFETGLGAFFYSPESNDTRGIGSQVFDQNGASPREGFVFMNYWQIFSQIFPRQLVPGQSKSVFNQEAGHRWGSFITLRPPGFSEILLGRDDGHWSYFMQSNGSPMEGNTWRDNTDGTFTTATGFNNYFFSDLDLYLMGLLAPGEVSPFFAIANPEIGSATDITGQPLNKSSSPQIVQPLRIRGTRVDITIDDISGANGTRTPVAGQAPNRWRSVFVMLAGRNSALDEADKVRFENMVDDYAAGFLEGTRNLGSLDYVLDDTVPLQPVGGPCNDVSECDPAVSNFCAPNPFTPVGVCSNTCADVSTCPTDWCCADAQGTQACLPQNLCPVAQPDAGVADNGTQTGADGGMSGGDGGVSTNPDGGSTGQPCGCDTTFGCDPDSDGNQCSCDRECNCACNTTDSCDMDSDGNECVCDTDCYIEDGCGCTQELSGVNTLKSTPWAGTGGIMLVLIGLLGLRRRRR